LAPGGHPNAIGVGNLLIEAVSACKKSRMVDPTPHQRLEKIRGITNK